MKRRDPAEDVRAELDAHFAGSVELLMARGWSEADARAEVARRFGDERRYRAELERAARRRSLRSRAGETWRAFASAVRSALRGLRRSPGLSLAVATTLALGLGANAAIFRVVDRLLLSAPPHIERPDEVRRLFRTVRYERGGERTMHAFTYAEVGAIRAAAPAVRVAALQQYVPETVGSGPEAVRVRVARVDAEYFPLLGVRAAVGRVLLPEDHARGEAVVVLSHSTWQTHFGGDPGVLGRRIRAARGEYQVVGVMPAGFHGSHAPASEMWIPLEAEAAQWWGEDWRTNPNVLAFGVLARVPPALSSEAWASRVATALRAADPGTTGRELLSVATSSLVPGDAPDPRATIPVARWVAGVSLLVLLVACANVANLFLADAERHRRETAVRLALGAGAGALRTELLTRALCLALLGAAGAVLFGIWGGHLLDGLFTVDVEPAARPDTTRLLVFTGALAVAAAALAGVLPALRLPRHHLREILAGGARLAGPTGFMRRALAGVQVALCMVLLIGAGLFIVSFRNALHVDLGFAHDRLIMLRLERDDGVETTRAQLLADARDRVLGVPHVVSAAGTVAVPFTLLYGLSASLGDDRPIEGLTVNVVGEDYFRTMGVPVDYGRALDARDMRAGAEPVVVVSRNAAVRLWPGRNPLEQCLHVGEEGSCARVVGVAGDHAGVAFTQGEIAPAGTLQAWVATGFPGTLSWSSLLVRTAVPPARVLADVRSAAMVPGVRYVEAELMSDMVARETRQWRLGATVFSLFGLIALLVAGIGLYGVLSFEVAQRRREFGIRAALGAGGLRTLLPVVRFAAPVVAAGVLLGGAVALLAAGRLADLLFEVNPRDPWILASAATVIVTVAAAALLVPGLRAATVDPRETLADG